jgi:SRSO17 transposase
MRSRLWVIILLLAWIGQWAIGTADLVLVQKASCWAVWRLVEDLGALVAYQARRRATWPPPRSHSRRRRQRGGRKLPFRRLRVLTTEEEEQEAQSEKAQKIKSYSVLAPHRWGLSPELSQELPERLQGSWEQYAECFKTKTRDTSEYAYHYLSGLLRMETKRNYTHIGRATGISGENIQHFMSNSPWSTQTVLEQVREEIKGTPGLERGGVVILDESADEAGEKKAGAGRQHNGRLGKVDLSQVGVFLAYANLTHPDRLVWTWVDGELFLQEFWFTPEMADLRKQLGIPPEQKFETKIEKGWEMIQRVQAQGLPFEAVACDDLYGRSTWFRDQVAGAGLVYMADVPRNTQVYLEQPVLGVPERKPGNRGPKPTRIQVLNGVMPFPVHRVARRADTTWARVRVRSIERGELNDPFAVRRVWTLREKKTEPVEEWLVIRCEAKNRYNYSLSNALSDASLEDLAWLKCQRYFVERANQDAKSEAGWDELEARKYRGWEHHLALVILAVWFAAQTKWKWVRRIIRDPTLAQQLAVDMLPALSMANIRLLLRAAMPLPQPTPEEAVTLVIEHLVNRTRSRSSRLKRQRIVPYTNVPP